MEVPLDAVNTKAVTMKAGNLKAADIECGGPIQAATSPHASLAVPKVPHPIFRNTTPSGGIVRATKSSATEQYPDRETELRKQIEEAEVLSMLLGEI